MWPSLPSFRPFGNIACPAGAKCQVPHCLFSHDAAKLQSAKAVNAVHLDSLDGGREAKRLKMNHGTKEPASQANRASNQTAAHAVFVGSITSHHPPAIVHKATSTTINVPEKAPTPSKTGRILPRSATRPISPPPKPEVEVRLTPRKLSKEPATFTRRLTFLTKLRQWMVPLNDRVAKAPQAHIKALHLSENQLNKLAVEEEENAALQNATVYENVLKQRLALLKKMSLDDWVRTRQEAHAKERGQNPMKPPPEPVNTGLTPKEEVIFLSRLISSQAGLDAHGYVTKQPTEAELESLRDALRSADHWEVCDRCNTRFQVFPDRREEDGALTTGGKCTHHWGKRVFAKKSKGDLPGPTRLSCCNEPVGSPGCTTHDTHVFKVSEAKRLSTIMPFIETPENDKVEPHTAVCFDCEMGYTTQGLELLRLTAVSWPTHKPIVDVLVRPLGQLLDVNTRFSGVTTEQYFSAPAYDPKDPTISPKDLRIVDSPYIARDLFLSHICPTTPILGHALENDLNTIRLIHPTIIDTVLLYPHHQGLPIRNGLRNLARIHLGLDIQQGGAAGHDSLEDARATGELVRLKVAQHWRDLKNEGWIIADEGVFPPVPKGEPPLKAPPAPSMVAPLPPSDMFFASKPAEKRKFGELEGEGETEGAIQRPAKRQE